MTVAAACGYRHLGVFNALFKKKFSVTPTEWRRNAAGKSHENGCLPDAAEPSPKSAGRKGSAGNGSVVTEK